MKKIVNIVIFIGLVFGLFAFIPNNFNRTTPEYTAYLNIYYSENFQLGKSIEVKTDIETLVIHEILSLNDNAKIGYIAIDKFTNSPLYLGDIKKNDKEVILKDFKNSKIKIYNLSNENLFDNFYNRDIINEIESLETPFSQEKMFGESCGPSWTISGSDCYQTCCDYFFWINIGCDVVGC
jgi:hypothetical protein